MSRVVHASPQDYARGAETVRGHVANSLQILEALIHELREESGEEFLVGRLDDLLGVRMRLKYALNILDTHP